MASVIKTAISRRAGARYEAEQSLSTNMASVTVCFLEKTGTEFNACRKIPPSGPWVSPKAPKLKFAESKQICPSFRYQTCNTFFDVRVKRDSRGNSKREGKVFLSFVWYFWPG